ncbi:hypothetical protein Cgig2_002963 [Carnegiea gigantea]|uniref:Uncharacterized protein n=1 Tax=Carnegiea gigantea TaxID=171969 RepID=A0A9Q1JJC7_9CARY|nr:hypothetical protein Cgig2_002963 [Carnegiea gigantea]
MDALKNLMTTMTDSILQQVTEHVRKTMKVVSSMRPLPTFDYVPTAGCKSHPADHLGSAHGLVRRARADLEASGSNLLEVVHSQVAFNLGAHTVCPHEGHPMLKKPQPIVVVLKLNNTRKYCEFHEQNGHTIEGLRKALHEHTYEGQIYHLKRGPWTLRKDCDLACQGPREEECSIKIVATIASGYAEGITHAA